MLALTLKGVCAMSTPAISDIKHMLAEIRSSLSMIEDQLIFAPTANLREAELRLRRIRDSVFPSGYFGDPAWDILLDLDRAARKNQAYAVTDAGIGANIAPTTALRYLAKLERDGLIKRQPDLDDNRRVFISLTSHGHSLMNQIFEETLWS
jgi:DNA-binding MarR family transcriptional regulator